MSRVAGGIIPHEGVQWPIRESGSALSRLCPEVVIQGVQHYGQVAAEHFVQPRASAIVLERFTNLLLVDNDLVHQLLGQAVSHLR